MLSREQLLADWRRDTAFPGAAAPIANVPRAVNGELLSLREYASSPLNGMPQLRSRTAGASQ
eukprot:8717124-Alexandrium_andersonii.AAC.1